MLLPWATIRSDMRTFTPTPTFVDAVINHPTVRPTVQQGVHRLAAAEYLSRPDTLARAFHGGVALFRQYSDGWDAHIFVLPSERGHAALGFGHLALEDLAKHTGGSGIILTAVPVMLPAARMYCRRLGLKPEGRDLFNEYFTAEIYRWAV